MSARVLLEAKSLTKTFMVGGREFTAVDNVDLQIFEGEVLGLVGESGSGKSTLAKTLLGLHHKSAGEVWFDGQCLARRYQRKDFQRQSEKMQMVFQDPSACLNPRMTVAEILEEPLLLMAKGGDRAKAVSTCLARVNLPASSLNRYPHEFSGGQRQRIGIARALVAEPQLLICDEPISALDVSVQAQIVNLLADLRRTMNLSLLFVAHDLSMVRYLSDRIAVMYLGQLMEVTTSERLFTEPLHPYSQLLLASNPIADPKRAMVVPSVDTNAKITEHKVTALKAEKDGCCFAPRCERAQALCWQRRPLLRPLEGGRLIACHYVE